MNTMELFTPKRRVKYIGPLNGKPLHPDRINKTARVIRPIKTRKCVCIEWDDTGQRYDAFPQNLVFVD
jgi:hypothetical protein